MVTRAPGEKRHFLEKSRDEQVLKASFPLLADSLTDHSHRPAVTFGGKGRYPSHHLPECDGKCGGNHPTTTAADKANNGYDSGNSTGSHSPENGQGAMNRITLERSSDREQLGLSLIVLFRNWAIDSRRRGSLSLLLPRRNGGRKWKRREKKGFQAYFFAGRSSMISPPAPFLPGCRLSLLEPTHRGLHKFVPRHQVRR